MSVRSSMRPPATAATPVSAPRIRVKLCNLGLAPENLRFEVPEDADTPRLADTIRAAGVIYPPIVRKGRKGEPVMLTALEFKTLKYLAQNARRVISRDELLNEVWGYENYPCTRTVDNHILRLRQKLEKNPSRPVHFRTVHGAGYKFLPQGSTS